MLNREKQQIQSFLKKLGHKNTLFSYSSGKVKAQKMSVTTNLASAVAVNNPKEMSDVYFYVNSGGTKINDIKVLNTLFCDIDAGRDSAGKYLSVRDVDRRKKKMAIAIKNYKIKPTFVVETRNGYQLYWTFKVPVQANSTTNHVYSVLLNKINTHFSSVGADTSVKRINQIMRLPNTVWYKPWENKKDVFKTKIVIENKTTYTFESLQAELTGSAVGVKKVNRANSLNWKPAANTQEQAKMNVQYQQHMSKYVNKSNDNLQLLIDIKDFLVELAPQLAFKQMKNSSKQAYGFIARLGSEYNV